jgi:hypothetical protein
MSNETLKALKQLRWKLDAEDPFMTRGHGIRKGREGTHSIPDWTKSDKRVLEVLTRSFPKANDRSAKQFGQHRRGFARWLRVIYLYYRMNWTQGEVAKEMGLSPKVVNHVLEDMNNVAKNLSANGRQPRRRGRKPDGFRIEDSTGRVVFFDELMGNE